MDTKITKSLRPGEKGTIKLAKKYGKKLICVRYHLDEAAKKRYKTVELIVDSWEVDAPRKRPKNTKKNAANADAQEAHEARGANAAEETLAQSAAGPPPNNPYLRHERWEWPEPHAPNERDDAPVFPMESEPDGGWQGHPEIEPPGAEVGRPQEPVDAGPMASDDRLSASASVTIQRDPNEMFWFRLKAYLPRLFDQIKQAGYRKGRVWGIWGVRWADAEALGLLEHRDVEQVERDGSALRPRQRQWR